MRPVVAAQNVESSAHDDDGEGDEETCTSATTTCDISRQSLLDSNLVHLIEASPTESATTSITETIIARDCTYNYWSTLLRLDLSRNLLRNLPDLLFDSCRNLRHLNLNRNRLHGLPDAIGSLSQLQSLEAIANNFRLAQLPLAALAALSHLKALDLRYNDKIKAKALETLQECLSTTVIISVTVKDEMSATPGEGAVAVQVPRLSAGERDATLLLSQLEPLSTPTLRIRAEETFGIVFAEDNGDDNGHADNNYNHNSGYDRQNVMTQLLEAYERCGPTARTTEYYQGIPVAQNRVDALYQLLCNLSWPKTTRERPKINAENYMILQKPMEGNISKKAERERMKVKKYQTLWDETLTLLEEYAPAGFCDSLTAVAVTHNFTGSPHIDTLNVAPFYAISFGEFEAGGGHIAVEQSPRVVAHVDTHGKLACMDGRNVHWVTPYTGNRYSLIFYVTYGTVVPRTTAVLLPTTSTCDPLVMFGNKSCLL